MPNPVQEGNLIFTDPPRHRQLRKLINTGFTRRQVAILEPKVRDIVHGVLADVRPGSTHEFADELAAPLPTRMIAELLGAPPDDWEQFRRWSDACTGSADPEIELDSLAAIGELFQYFHQLIAARRAEPRNDVISIFSLGAEVDGANGCQTRTSTGSVVGLSFAHCGKRDHAGSDRGGHVGAHSPPGACLRLIDAPSLITGAIEEMLRWTSP